MLKLNLNESHLDSEPTLNLRGLNVHLIDDGWFADQIEIETWLFSSTAAEVQLLGLPAFSWCRTHTDIILTWLLEFDKFQILELDYEDLDENARGAVNTIDLKLNVLEDAIEHDVLLITSAGYYSYPNNPLIEITTSRNSHERFLNIRNGKKTVIVEISDF